MTTTEEFELLGLQHGKMKHANSVKVRLRRFKALYGCSPEACKRIWDDLKEDDENPTLTEKHLLMALRFLRLYEVEEIFAAVFDKEEQMYQQQKSSKGRYAFNVKDEQEPRWDGSCR